jgi:hypothetical protein
MTAAKEKGPGEGKRDKRKKGTNEKADVALIDEWL